MEVQASRESRTKVATGVVKAGSLMPALRLSDPQASGEGGGGTLIFFFYWSSHTQSLVSVLPLNALTERMLLKGRNSAGIWQFTRSSGV